jgi:hypothetical protein
VSAAQGCARARRRCLLSCKGARKLLPGGASDWAWRRGCRRRRRSARRTSGAARGRTARRPSKRRRCSTTRSTYRIRTRRTIGYAGGGCVHDSQQLRLPLCYMVTVWFGFGSWFRSWEPEHTVFTGNTVCLLQVLENWKRCLVDRGWRRLIQLSASHGEDELKF